MTRRLAAWIGILAIALQALWPLLAAARPPSTALVPVCTVEGITHYYELPVAATPLEQRSESHHEHCSFCLFGGHAALSPDRPMVLPAAPASGLVPAIRKFFRVSSPFAPGQPRAPPFLQYVEDTTNDTRRIYAEDLRRIGAGGTDSGIRVLRRGVLHD